MPIFMEAVVVSVVFLAITAAIAHSRFGARGAALFSVVSSFVSLSLVSSVLLTQSAFTFVLALLCTVARAKPKVLVWGSFVAAAIIFGIVGLGDYFEQRKYQALRERFPLESVAGRLAYEATTTLTSSLSPLSSHVDQRLSEIEKRETPTLRQHWLMFLHESKSTQFKKALGFGSGRMVQITSQRVKENVVIPDVEPILVPPTQEQPYAPDGTPVPLADRPRPDDADLLSMHTSDQNDFLAPERFGYVKDRDHVAGFVPHRFTKTLEPKTEFQLVRLELVSLLKHEVPVAYVSKHLPQMDELKDAPTRPLDDFERGAIDQLRSDEDLVIDDAPNRIRMVGSLRAGKDCRECHSVRRGELLGAFSYELIGGREERRAEPGA